jgi:hypothetical protein
MKKFSHSTDRIYLVRKITKIVYEILSTEELMRMVSKPNSNKIYVESKMEFKIDRNWKSG